MTNKEVRTLNRKSSETGNLRQTLGLIISEAINSADEKAGLYGVGALSYKSCPEHHSAIALTQHKKLLVASAASVSEYTDPLTMQDYLQLFPIELPDGWVLDMAPGEWFEFDDESNAIYLVGPLE